MSNNLKTAVKPTDEQIEELFMSKLGSWNGDFWKIEDADLHPFVREVISQFGRTGVAEEYDRWIKFHSAGEGDYEDFLKKENNK